MIPAQPLSAGWSPELQEPERLVPVALLESRCPSPPLTVTPAPKVPGPLASKSVAVCAGRSRPSCSSEDRRPVGAPPRSDCSSEAGPPALRPPMEGAGSLHRHGRRGCTPGSLTVTVAVNPERAHIAARSGGHTGGATLPRKRQRVPSGSDALAVRGRARHPGADGSSGWKRRLSRWEVGSAAARTRGSRGWGGGGRGVGRGSPCGRSGWARTSRGWGLV
jgi:hypothetical protein